MDYKKVYIFLEMFVAWSFDSMKLHLVHCLVLGVLVSQSGKGFAITFLKHCKYIILFLLVHNSFPRYISLHNVWWSVTLSTSYARLTCTHQIHRMLLHAYMTYILHASRAYIKHIFCTPCVQKSNASLLNDIKMHSPHFINIYFIIITTPYGNTHIS